MPRVQEPLATRVQDGSGAGHLYVVPTRVEPDANDAPLGAISVEVDGVDLRPGNDARSLHCDLAVHGAGPSAS
jgi:hypothetical protein